MQLLNPPWLEGPPRNFPKVLDLTNFQVLELGHEHVGHYDVSIDHPIEAHYATYRLKVVFLRSSTIDSDDFIMFSMFGISAVLRSGEKNGLCLKMWVALGILFHSMGNSMPSTETEEL
ncbi:hypothetical protein PVK06_004481 [Gossypium arboreum]|uniref:Uncharacterized protein n=1 Tax=Gossypium arboreum TaxID=29729 RepID=A0ABR0QTG5_GOSAR|nr:hypothetical protein PVK06_004481 [Gossypium arboreum]